MNEHDGHEHHEDEHVEETHETHAETPWDIITDPPHFAAEMFFEGIFLVLSALFVKYKLRKRDKAHHHAEAHAH